MEARTQVNNGNSTLDLSKLRSRPIIHFSEFLIRSHDVYIRADDIEQTIKNVAIGTDIIIS